MEGNRMQHLRSVPTSRANASAGFTLIELMIIVALLAIFATIALPNLSSFMRSNQVQAQAQAVQSFLQFARMESIDQRKPVKVSLDASSNWVATVRVNGSDEVIRQLGQASSQAQMAADANDFSFQSNGTASGTARFIVCGSEAIPGNGYLIDVQRSGAVKLHARGADLSSCDARASGGSEG
jgi:prepilin-type N-terminal cleavage/methylation domain-containing protein